MSRRLRGGVALTLMLVLASSTLACTEQSPTEELGQDPADVTIAGPAPTAPPTTEYDGRGLTSNANQLLDQLEALQDEQDLCLVVVGDSLQPFLTGDVDTTTLITSPSGLTQLLSAVNGLFDHIVLIAPPEVQPATATLRDMWTRVAAVAAIAPDSNDQIDAIVNEPGVTAAGESLVNWITANCDTSALVTQENP